MKLWIKYSQRITEILIWVLLIISLLVIAVVLDSKSEGESSAIFLIKKMFSEYIEVTDGCGPHFEGACLNVRSGPGEDYPVVTQLRNSVVLKADGKVERDGRTWYKIAFNEWLRHPDRIKDDWYVLADYVDVLPDNIINPIKNRSAKRIVIDRSEQMLYAYNNNRLFIKESISTGLQTSPTPRGIFSIYKKTPSRYMQGPIVGITDQYYDLPGVPWNLYFSYQGAVIHGTYWHQKFGKQASHGCVNLPPEQAKKLYTWAEVGTRVIVRD